MMFLIIAEDKNSRYEQNPNTVCKKDI